jgi:hypothetical protein
MFFFLKKSNNGLCIILNLQKTNYLIRTRLMLQNCYCSYWWKWKDELGEVGEEGQKVPRIPSGIDQSFQIDLLKWSVNTDAQSRVNKNFSLALDMKLSDAESQ